MTRFGLQGEAGGGVYRSVIFVHGTGVRGDKFASTLNVVRERIHREMPALDVRGCYWGDAHGARLNLGGLSIPDYHRTQGGERDTPEERELSRWAVHYADPWHDLRLLGLGPEAESADEDDFLDDIDAYQPSPATTNALRTAGLEPYFELALSELRRSPEIQEAAATVDPAGVKHRGAAARALVAYTLAAAQRDGRPTPVGEVRDTIHSHVIGDLSAQDRGPGALFKKVALAIASPVATWYGQQHRGSVSDGATPLTGDILRYQVHGDGLRKQIAQTVKDAPGQAVTLIGHSLGGVACVELLAEQGPGKVDQLITVGSQASYLYEIDTLSCLPFDQGLPAHFPARWLNVFDKRDLLSYPAQPVFVDRVQDLCVDNKQPFIESHSAYWTNDRVWKAVTAWIG